MDKQALHKIILELKDLIEQLECEVMSDPDAYLADDENGNYHEYFDDDDGYCD